MKTLLFITSLLIFSGCSNTNIQNNVKKKTLSCQENALKNIKEKELDTILPIASFDYYITKFCNDKLEPDEVSAFLFKELIDNHYMDYETITIETSNPTIKYSVYDMVILNKEKQDKLVHVLSKLQSEQNKHTFDLYYKQNNKWNLIKLPIWVSLQK
jgi:hypothetical protein